LIFRRKRWKKVIKRCRRRRKYNKENRRGVGEKIKAEGVDD